MLIGIKNDFYGNSTSKEIRLIQDVRGANSSAKKVASSICTWTPCHFSILNPCFLVRELMENTVGNVLPRGIPIPLTHTHTLLSLDYSFIHKYLLSAHSCARHCTGGGHTRMNLTLWIVQSSIV